MSARPEIETLLRQVARRYDGFLARRVAIVTIIAASGLAIAVSLFWVLRGHAVPPRILLAVGGVAVIGGLVSWWLKRMRPDAAVRERVVEARIDVLRNIARPLARIEFGKCRAESLRAAKIDVNDGDAAAGQPETLGNVGPSSDRRSASGRGWHCRR